MSDFSMLLIFITIGFFVGLIAGVIAGRYLLIRKPLGFLRVDKSNSVDEPYLFLELTESPNEIEKNTYVTFIVKSEDFIPQK